MRKIPLNPPPLIPTIPIHLQINNKIYLRVALLYMIVGRSDMDPVTVSFEFCGGAVVALEIGADCFVHVEGIETG